jgi:hypothetical protein
MEEDMQLSRPPMVTPWGKCVAAVKTMIPEETERLLRAHAARCGSTESEVIRNMLMEKFHGRDMAEASLLNHFRATVRTGTETSTAQEMVALQVREATRP